MNFKSPGIIVFCSLIVITIVCFALTNICSPLSIVGSITLVVAFSMMTWWSFIRYLIYKRNVEDKRATDAYLYAEKMGSEQAAENFSYPKKVERKLRQERYNRFIVPVCCLVLTIIAIFLFLITTKII